MKQKWQWALLWAGAVLVAAGCAGPTKSQNAATSNSDSQRTPASTSANLQMPVNVCGQLFYAESNRNAVDDSDANYFLRVDCNYNGMLDKADPSTTVSIVDYRNSQERGALTNTRRKAAKALDAAQAQIYKSITPSGWLAASKNPKAPLPFEKVKNYRSYVVYMCADLTTDGNPCAGGAAPTVNARLNRYVTELDKVRLPRTKTCIQQNRQNCFPE